VTLSIFSQIRSIFSRQPSKTALDCPVYQAIQRAHALKIVELGIGRGQRAIKMIETAKKASPEQTVHYVGIDLFEGRDESAGPGLTLKEAHQLLRRDGVRVQLVPGNLADSLIRIANSLGKVDLLILPAELDSPSCSRVWYFVPRMLHNDSQVFIERTGEDGQRVLEPRSRQEIANQASLGVRRRAA
jgi:hypothetical protein